MDRLQAMKVFDRVVEEGSFAAAARAMDMSPPVVTRMVAELEQHLGTRLLQRTTRKLALTDAGETYLQRVRAILGEIEDAEAAASMRDLKGALRIVTTPALATHFLAPMVALWHAEYPKLMLDVIIDTLASDRVDEFDVTIMIASDDFDANIVARPLLHGEAIVVASPGYLKRLPKEAFGIMISMEPAVAAVLAMGLLGEHLSAIQWLAIGCIVAASMGSAATAARPVGGSGNAHKKVAASA